MAKEESVFKVVLTLVLIAMVSAILLAWVNKITREPIELNKRAETKRAVKIVLRGLKNIAYPEFPEEMEVDHSPVKYFKAVGIRGVLMGGAFIVKAPNGFSGDFEMMVGVDSSGLIIDTYVLDHKETPGLGDGMLKESFKEQFRGKRLAGTTWMVRKDGGDIDAITAATITSRAFTAGVKRALQAFERLKKEGQK
ncbi:MAG TPA: RnfABCDGE type electron transport complex subunit G [Caldithrix abyssi]|uniref:Ion-translocating oxidoreductase complex subunit G n=1 Tax=Caldithrix abyssi TaxID=187145 RepID=A0A7V4U3C6_CALAY|nr:RnfABCDGE type electron transport complex subunit G [Caldithrix abyssi]